MAKVTGSIDLHQSKCQDAGTVCGCLSLTQAQRQEASQQLESAHSYTGILPDLMQGVLKVLKSSVWYNKNIP